MIAYVYAIVSFCGDLLMYSCVRLLHCATYVCVGSGGGGGGGACGCYLKCFMCHSVLFMHENFV